MSLRGNLKLIHNGFEFLKQRDGAKGVTHWTCVKSRWNHCKGKARTFKDGHKEMVKLSCAHNHLPDKVKSEI